MASFLSGLLGPAVRVATGAATDYQGAKAQSANAQRSAAIQAIMLARQQRQAEIENGLKLAQTGKENAEAKTYTPEYAGQKAGAEANAQLPAHLQVLVQQGIISAENAQNLANLQHQNRTSEIGQEGGIKTGLQNSAQNFAGTQNDLNRKNASDIAAGNRAAAGDRTQAEIAGSAARLKQTQGGQFLPSIVHGVGKVMGAAGDALSDGVNRIDGLMHSSPASTTTAAPNPVATSPSPTGKPPLEARISQLKTQGFTKSAARAQLQDEGYDLSAGGTP